MVNPVTNDHKLDVDEALFIRCIFVQSHLTQRLTHAGLIWP